MAYWQGEIVHKKPEEKETEEKETERLKDKKDAVSEFNQILRNLLNKNGVAESLCSSDSRIQEAAGNNWHTLDDSGRLILSSSDLRRAPAGTRCVVPGMKCTYQGVQICIDNVNKEFKGPDEPIVFHSTINSQIVGIDFGISNAGNSPDIT